MNKYINIQGIKTEDNEIIPIWDNRIKYHNDDFYGKYLTLEGSYTKYITLIDCIYNIKTKEISIGIEVNNYPTKLDFTKGQEVYYEKSHRELAKSTIKDIIYKEFDLNIYKGKKLDGWYKKLIKE